MEVISSGQVYMTWGWGVVRRACTPAGRHVLHFRMDGLASLTFKVFEEDGRRRACSEEEGLADDHFRCYLGAEAWGEVFAVGSAPTPLVAAPLLPQWPRALTRATSRRAAALAVGGMRRPLTIVAAEGARASLLRRRFSFAWSLRGNHEWPPEGV